MARGPVQGEDIPMKAEAPAGNMAELFSQKINPSVVGKHERAARDLSEVPKPERYRVAAPCSVMVGGFKTRLLPPKIVTSSEYDIRLLQDQGAQLVKLED